MRYLLPIFIFIAGVNAATYYVDFDVGVNLNNGTSTSTPWKHAPGDNNSYNTPASTTLQAGDTIKFKGGVSYEGMVHVWTSGSNGSPITYDGNHDNDWGSGRAVMDNQNDTSNTSAFRGGTNVSYITIQGFEITNQGGYAEDDPVYSGSPGSLSTARTGSGIRFWSGGDNLIVNNCYIHEIGTWQNSTVNSGGGVIQGTGILYWGVSDSTISNCEFTRMQQGVKFASHEDYGPAENLLLENSSFHNHLVWCVDIGPRHPNTTIENVTIRNCNFYDYHEYTTGSWTGAGEKPHTDGIFLRNSGTGSVTWTNMVVDGCHFWTDDNNGGNGGTASIYVSEGPSVNIWNCTFRRTIMGDDILVDWPNTSGTYKQIVRIYNNSFHNSIRLVRVEDENDPARREWYMANNVLYSTMPSTYSTPLSVGFVDPTVLDYDMFWDPNYPAGGKDVANIAGVHLLTSELPSIGFGTNSTYQDPLYVTEDAVLPSGNDLRLQAGSPAIGAGTDLSAFFTTDAEGKTRSSWDAGAYEYAAATNTPPSISVQPQSGTYTVGDNVTLSVTASGTATLTNQWKKAAVNLPGETASTLSLSNIQLTDAGAYSVAITNGFGDVLSDTANITVNSPPDIAPYITSQPQSASYQVGQVMLLSVEAAGTEPLTYQWKKDAVNITDETSTSYQIDSLVLTNAGSYTVAITNDAGDTLSSAAVITVNEAQDDDILNAVTSTFSAEIIARIAEVLPSYQGRYKSVPWIHTTNVTDNVIITYDRWDYVPNTNTHISAEDLLELMGTNYFISSQGVFRWRIDNWTNALPEVGAVIEVYGVNTTTTNNIIGRYMIDGTENRALTPTEVPQ